MADAIKVLLVDDSPTFRHMLRRIIDADPGLTVIGEAQNGEEAVDKVRELRPNVVLMDLIMPGMNGLETTSEIMHDTPTPVIVVSASLETWETDIAFDAINAGALAVYQKPVGPRDPDHAEQIAALLNTVRTMAGVRVIHHWRRGDRPRPEAIKEIVRSAAKEFARPELTGIVSSTGGPAALSEIIKALPANLSYPVAIAQHIAADFVPSMVSWLSSLTPLPITIAREGESPRSGHIYVSPADAHLSLTSGRRFHLERRPGLSRYTPSGDILLQSMAAHYGNEAVGVVLTGMGDDGARGLKAMHDAGALTIAQDEATSVVFGMPKEAIQLGAALHVLPIGEIAAMLVKLSNDNALSEKEGDNHE